MYEWEDLGLAIVVIFNKIERIVYYAGCKQDQGLKQ